ncbi:leucine-rich repeats and immunoglobulin-like domains protein 2 isoform X2 [Watersipora subatra]|uniref:leucine-rich repeats and immunoglobulin-like domains protein 2 isoform X2 n=1 Tax=Watersipora subatra TaxID=2589382 RepID=UPI00355C2AC0
MNVGIHIVWISAWLILGHLPRFSYSQGLCRTLNNGFTDCSNKELTYVPRNLPATTRTLRLSRNRLTRIEAGDFPIVMPELEELDLTENAIRNLDTQTFCQKLPNLQVLRLSRNKLTVLPDLSNCQYLRELHWDLSRNRLTEIGYVYFGGLKKLKVLSLERNRLSSLRDGAFYQCISLESLNLQSNLLTSVKAGPFFSLKNMQSLNLARNSISSIDNQTWSQASASAISNLDLSENKLSVIQLGNFVDARNLKQLNLSSNRISQIEEASFMHLRTLETLDLRNNELSDSLQSPANAVFSSLSSLVSLQLSGNKLQSITSKLLRGLEALQTLELGENPVAMVESYAFSTLPSLISLEMDTSSLVCDCKISWLPPWLEQRGMSSTVEGRCAHPPALVGQSIFEIELQRFECPKGEMPVTPFITREMQAANALRGSNVTLTCIATASRQSELTVEWRKDSKVIPDSAGLIQTEMSTSDDRVGVALYTTYLRLINVTEEAEGAYQCGFQNEFGQDYSSNVPLQVLVFPSFTNKPRNVTVKTGQSAKLLCEATGYPQPFLSWSKDGGKNFPAARDRRFLVNPGNLNEFIIKDVQWADRGDYFCNATNSAGSIISNATVNVLVPPMFTEDITCTNTEAGTYLLKCQADGNPRTPIIWYKDGKLIQASEKYIFSVSFNNLFIIDATPEDSGKYMCSAKNLLGQVTQMCEINVEDSSAMQSTENSIASVKKTTMLDQKTITGLIVIAVVCCVVGTSLVWVVIIHQTRRRQNRNKTTNTGGTTDPLNSLANGSNSAYKMADNLSNTSGSSNTKTDSFLEYQSSRESPSAFYKVAGRFPTMDSELAAAMEPLNPSQQSADSLSSEVHPHPYSHHTVGASGYARRISPEYYAGEKAHPFSTFQPSKQTHRLQQTDSGRPIKASQSISAEYIPYIDKRMPPPDLAHVLHQLRAPTQPPQAVVNPVRAHKPAAATSLKHLAYEEPGYMNLPRSAVTPSASKSSAGQYSDYMNVEPRDIHIYQNTSILSIHPSDTTCSQMSPSQADPPSPSADSTEKETQAGASELPETFVAATTSNPDSSFMRAGRISKSSLLNGSSLTPLTNQTCSPVSLTSDGCRSCHSNYANQSNFKTPADTNKADDTKTTSDLTNVIADTRADMANMSKLSDDSASRVSLPRRREALADSSFVEKYGLTFADASKS